MTVINPFAEDCEGDLAPGMDAIFDLVCAFAEKLHGPLDNFSANDRAVLTGKYVGFDDTKPAYPDICNNKRLHGGTLQRFFSAHWELRPGLKSWHGPYHSSWPAMWVRYGWALSNLQAEIPELNAVDPGDIEFEVPDDIEEAA